MKNCRFILNFRQILVQGNLFLVLLIIVGCGTPREKFPDPQNFNELKSLVESREFSIAFQWAQPQGGGLVDLMSNPNYLRFNGEEVDIFLPYFGIRHSGGGYGKSEGINYRGEPLKLRISEDRSKNNILIQFEGRQGSELLFFQLTLYENEKAFLNVSSSERTNINYQGGNVKSTQDVSER